MKPCPYCAEEIQDAAIVCRFCNRDLIAAPSVGPVTIPPATSKAGNALAWIAVGAISFLVLAFVIGGYEPEPAASSSAPDLRVSVGRGGGGYAVTNREPEAISNCLVGVMDGADEWIARMFETLEPNATVQLPWQRFIAKGQPLPSFIGLNAHAVTVNCDGRMAGAAF